MKYIIFGCGEDGNKAMTFLGESRVECFIDNYKIGTIFKNKMVVSIQYFLDTFANKENILLVIASFKYQEEMKQQLHELGYTDYVIFNSKKIPSYMLNGKRIVPCCLNILQWEFLIQDKKIVIFGENENAVFIKQVVQEINEFSEIVITEDEIELLECESIIINMKRDESDIRNSELLKNKNVIDIYGVERNEMKFYNPELKRYKNIHIGKRIFLIGNGPSLRIDDLEKLYSEGEICIGFNKLYRAYDKTSFRANYICFSDYDVINDCFDDLKKIPGTVLVADHYHRLDNPYDKEIQYYHLFMEGYYPYIPEYSDDIVKGTFLGFSVIYDIGLQLASYMGATEIYILGADHNFVGKVTDANNYFISNYYKDDEHKKYDYKIFQKEKIDKAFEAAEMYSREHGFRIYNATRGGNLEVFERVDFDTLFN